MSDPFTVQFGPWSPDLQNVATELPGAASPAKVPTADVMNVYYQDGNYQCLPSPASFGPTLTNQVLTSFTWYDRVNGQEIVFNGESGGIEALISTIIGGPLTVQAIPVENTLTVFVTGMSMRVSLFGQIYPLPLNLSLSLGTPTYSAVNGFTYKGTMVAGEINNSGHQGSIITIGFIYGDIGSINPANDLRGHKIGSITTSENIITGLPTTYHTSVVIDAPNLGAGYFTKFLIPTIGVSLATANAGYSTTSTNSAWVWNNQSINLVSGNSYAVELS